MTEGKQTGGDRDQMFWLRLALTALIVSVPWAYAMVMYGLSPVFALIAVGVSGMVTLLVWDGTRMAKAVMSWLRGEPMRDSESGLYNPQAWEELLSSEEDRCKRYELPASVVVVKVRGPGGSVPNTPEAGRAIRKVSRAHDIVACLSEDTYAILAINSKQANAEALIERLRTALTAGGFLANFTVASRESSLTIPAAYRDAVRGGVHAA